MNRDALSALVALALAVGWAAADDQDVKAKAGELVEQLSSDDAAVRDKATEDLSKLGPEAIPVIEDALRSDDPEVQWRAEKALAAIRDASRPKEEARDEAPPRQAERRRGSGMSVQVRITGAGRTSITQDGDGHITLKVTEEDENGEKVTKTYEAGSPEEFKEKYPDVAKKHGIGEDRGTPQVLEPPDFKDLDDLWKDFGKGLEERMREMMDTLRQGGLRSPRRPRPPKPPGPDPQEPGQEGTAPEAGQAPDEGRGGEASTDGFGAEVSFIDEALRDQLDLPGDGGVVVTEVAPDSPAAKAGLEVHDVVLSVNGEPVKTKWDFRRLLLEGASGGKLALEVVRKGEPKTLDVDPGLLKK